MLNRILFRGHLEEDELLVRIVHKHWLLGVRALLWPSVFFGGACFLLSLQPTRGVFSVFALGAVVVLVWWLRNFFDYFLDAWIITTHGIIDVAWHGWFHRQSARILYSDVQGVSYEIKGVLPTLLRFGTVSVEKVSTGEAVSLESVKNPRKVEATVLKCMEDYLHSKNMKDSKHVQQILASMVAQQIQLRELQGVSDESDE